MLLMILSSGNRSITAHASLTFPSSVWQPADAVCIACRHYEDLFWMTDEQLGPHYKLFGHPEGRVAQRIRVVATYEAAAGRDPANRYGGLCNQIYSHIGMLAVLLHMGAEVVRLFHTQCATPGSLFPGVVIAHPTRKLGVTHQAAALGCKPQPHADKLPAALSMRRCARSQNIYQTAWTEFPARKLCLVQSKP